MDNSQIVAFVHKDYLPFIKVMTKEEIGEFILAQINKNDEEKGEESTEMTPLAKAAYDTHCALESRFYAVRQKKIIAGSKGGNPTLKNKALLNQCLTSAYPEVNQCLTSGKAEVNQSLSNDKPLVKPDTDTVTDTVTDTKENEENENARAKKTRAKKVFVPPSVEEIQKYCEERNSDVDPKRFFDYFDASGWIDSKGNAVRNWKQKLITWEGHGNGTNANNKVLSSVSTDDIESPWGILGDYY